MVLDPGHGGVDPGATSRRRRATRRISCSRWRASCARLIERSGRYRVVLTRDGDEFIRAARPDRQGARKLGGEIFISLHADSLRLAEQRGASIYTLSETGVGRGGGAGSPARRTRPTS